MKQQDIRVKAREHAKRIEELEEQLKEEKAYLQAMQSLCDHNYENKNLFDQCSHCSHRRYNSYR